MNYTFNNNQNLKDFAIHLQSELIKINQIAQAEEIHEWINTYFTTSSEYLGEFLLILKKIQNINLPNELNEDVLSAINEITKAFKMNS